MKSGIGWEEGGKRRCSEDRVRVPVEGAALYIFICLKGIPPSASGTLLSIHSESTALIAAMISSMKILSIDNKEKQSDGTKLVWIARIPSGNLTIQTYYPKIS